MNNHELEEWKERLVAQKASGLTVKQWCKKNNVTNYKYYYWYKIINDSKDKLTKASPITFGEVNLCAPVTISSGIKISYQSVEISLYNKNDVGLAVAVINELQRIC